MKQSADPGLERAGNNPPTHDDKAQLDPTPEPLDEEGDLRAAVARPPADEGLALEPLHEVKRQPTVISECGFNVPLQRPLRERSGGVRGQHRGWTGAEERLGDRLRKSVTQPIDVDGEPALVSASIGVSLVQAGPDLDTEAAISRADTAMYEAKAAGRNATVIAPLA